MGKMIKGVLFVVAALASPRASAQSVPWAVPTNLRPAVASLPIAAPPLVASVPAPLALPEVRVPVVLPPPPPPRQRAPAVPISPACVVCAATCQERGPAGECVLWATPDHRCCH